LFYKIKIFINNPFIMEVYPQNNILLLLLAFIKQLIY